MSPGWSGQTHALRRKRGQGATILLSLVLGILIVAFFRIQVLRSGTYRLQSQENRLRAISVPAPRGTIYDRNGRVVAENVPGYVISLLPSRRDTTEAAIRQLAPYLDLGPAAIEALMERYTRFPNAPLVLRDNATFEQAAILEERRPEFPRAVVEMRPRRRYPAGPAIAHLIGYVGEISEAELESPAYAEYEPGRIVGKDGLERQYESTLGGKPGVRYVEVNALGTIVHEVDPSAGIPVESGQDLQLGIDLGLQILADSIFPEGMRGGAVALDPRTGEVLLLSSHPTFDPNQFIGGIDLDLWSSLRDNPDNPLLNRVTTATYSPGSTWKLVLSTIGMKRDRLAIDSYMPTGCRGALGYGNRVFRCWKPDGHGPLDLARAIKRSCNVFFYQAGQRIGLEALLEGATELGFNQPTGIDLPFEASGLYPDSRDWFDRRYGSRGWTESVVLNLSIGQGENQQTLLRQASFYAALATGESPVVPHLVRSEAMAARRMDWTLGLTESQRRDLLGAMIRVVNEQGGTANMFALDQWTLAGKTGTAQNPHGEPHSWFVGFAPAQDPQIVIAAIVEFGHPDNTVSLAVPFAAQLVQRYLESAGIAPEADLTDIPPATGQ
jgi:penicillin-binding protein 2